MYLSTEVPLKEEGQQALRIRCDEWLAHRSCYPPRAFNGTLTFTRHPKPGKNEQRAWTVYQTTDGVQFQQWVMVPTLHLVPEPTQKLVLAPGIANIYNRHPGVMLQAANTLAEQLPGRFVLGLGVSSPVIVSKIRGIEYTRPYSFMVDYLEKMSSARYFSIPPATPAGRQLQCQNHEEQRRHQGTAPPPRRHGRHLAWSVN